MAEVAVATKFLGDFAAHLLSGIKLVGSFLVDFFRIVWTVMWTGGLPTFLLFGILVAFFLFALVKFVFHNFKHLIIILIILALVSFFTAMGLVL